MYCRQISKPYDCYRKRIKTPRRKQKLRTYPKERNKH